MAGNSRYSPSEGYPQDITEITHLLSQSFDKDMIISRVLERISGSLDKRARYCVYEEPKLVIRNCVGEYCEEIKAGKEIIQDSVVWKAFERGKAVNFIHPSQCNGYQHTLREQVKVKAVVPLVYVDPRTQQNVKFGMLVVDSGKTGRPITDDEFTYLLVMADLVAETVGKSELVQELVQSYGKRREMMIDITDYLRNRIMAIGGFSRRLHGKLRSGKEKEYALIITNEVQKLQEHLETIERMFKQEEERVARPKTTHLTKKRARGSKEMDRQG